MKNILAILLLLILFSITQTVSAGAACVVALWKGSVLDYVFLNSPTEHPHVLQEQAEKMLAEKGYDDYDRGLDIRHARGQTYLNSAYAVILESNYVPAFRKVEKQRRSIGCGFSRKSYDDALWEAIRDMQSHDWSWKPDRDGYEVIEQVRY